MNDTKGITLGTIAMAIHPKRKSIDIKTGCLSSSRLKYLSFIDFRIRMDKRKTSIGSVGNQKSKERPGIILINGIDNGAKNANPKKSFSGAKKTQTLAKRIKGIIDR